MTKKDFADPFPLCTSKSFNVNENKVIHGKVFGGYQMPQWFYRAQIKGPGGRFEWRDLFV
jgi:hypothetical protein